MMVVRRRSTSSRDQEIRRAFWLCSRPETATPPALAAFAGPNGIFRSRNAWTASSVEGMLALPPRPAARCRGAPARRRRRARSAWRTASRSDTECSTAAPPRGSRTRSAPRTPGTRPRRTSFSSFSHARRSASIPVRVVDEPVRVRGRDDGGAELGQLLDAVERDVPGAGDARGLAGNLLVPRRQHVLQEVDGAVAGRLGPHEAAAEGEALAGEDAGETVGQPHVLAEQKAESRARRRRCRPPERQCPRRCGGAAPASSPGRSASPRSCSSRAG